MYKLISLLLVCLLNSCVSSNGLFVPTKQNEFVAQNVKLEKLWDGGIFTEGPTPDKDGNILFTDIRVNRIMKYYRETGTVRIFKK